MSFKLDNMKVAWSNKNRTNGYTLKIDNLNITLRATVYLSRTKANVSTLLRKATNHLNGITRTQDYLRAQEKLENV